MPLVFNQLLAGHPVGCFVIHLRLKFLQIAKVQARIEQRIEDILQTPTKGNLRTLFKGASLVIGFDHLQPGKTASVEGPLERMDFIERV